MRIKMVSIEGFTIICALLGLFTRVSADLKLGFYDESCPKAEKIVSDYVNKHIPNAPSLAAALLRMHFHDCFVSGCDASVLLDSTSKNQTEKTSGPNLTLRGFGFIDGIKSLLEKECPGVVSCADIISLVARDSVVVTGGPFWYVPTGRRDGLLSRSSEALANIPFPTFNFSALTKAFASKGLNVTDLILLSGAHTIGVSHCSSFSNRLYNFTGKGDEDPALDKFYAANLKKLKCKNPNDNTTIVEMDPGSFRTFDLGYYKLLLKRRGLFQSDAALTSDPSAKAAIRKLLDSPVEVFLKDFALSMEKMGRIQVKTGSAGEIRKHCAVVNS
ncbi:peroxidase 3-like [Iris pallida]|uniref:Peroxidase n=1 Tax=Iris pallida TaxID=29817 RepID=A0AAX6E0K1_IRIPA|nr:peroxidase 3-like [Iris pallida]